MSENKYIKIFCNNNYFSIYKYDEEKEVYREISEENMKGKEDELTTK